MQLSIGEVIVKLREFGIVMNDEVGEAILSMCNLYSYSDYLSDEFSKAEKKTVKFRIGDIVEVTNIGNVYSTYRMMAANLGVSNWHYNATPITRNMQYIVKGWETVRNYREIIVYIESRDEHKRGYLIEQDGIKIAKPNDFLTEEDFEL